MPGVVKTYRREAAVEYEQALERLKLGSSEAASPVRRIDPATGIVIEILSPLLTGYVYYLILNICCA
jgi:hypothetical protein